MMKTHLNLQALKLAALAGLTALLVTGCATTKKDFEQALAAHTITAYEAFLQKHPTSQYSGQARQRLAALEAKQLITETGTVADFEAFLAKHPTGEAADWMRKVMKELDKWPSSTDEKTLKTWIRMNPTSPRRAEIEGRIAKVQRLRTVLESDPRVTGVKAGMSGADLEALMGKPDEPFTVALSFGNSQFEGHVATGVYYLAKEDDMVAYMEVSCTVGYDQGETGRVNAIKAVKKFSKGLGVLKPNK